MVLRVAFLRRILRKKSLVICVQLHPAETWRHAVVLARWWCRVMDLPSSALLEGSLRPLQVSLWSWPALRTYDDGSTAASEIYCVLPACRKVNSILERSETVNILFKQEVNLVSIWCFYLLIHILAPGQVTPWETEHSLVSTVSLSMCHRIHESYPLQEQLSLA